MRTWLKRYGLFDNELSLIQQPMMSNTYTKYDQRLKSSGRLTQFSFWSRCESIAVVVAVGKKQQRNGSLFIGSFLVDVKYLSVCLFIVFLWSLRKRNVFVSHHRVWLWNGAISNHNFAEWMYKLQATRLSHEFEIEIWIIYRLLYSKIAALLNIYNHLSLKWSVRWEKKKMIAYEKPTSLKSIFICFDCCVGKKKILLAQ